jgi:hypothetical protein
MKHYESQKRLNGKFVADGEPAVSKLTVRVSPTLRAEVERMSNGKVAEWLREAIAEKIARETQQESA